MRGDNELRKRVESGDPVVGARARNPSPMLIEVYGDLGLDFAWIDFEHGGESPWNAPMLESLVRAGEVAGVDLLVRLPTGDPSLVRKVLDAGVRTVLIPRIESAEEIRRAVRAARFRYDGEVGDRGIGTGYVNRWGASADETYAEREDEAVLVGAMIENRTAVEDLGSILDVPDLGFVFLGPSDLSTSYGRPLETDHQDVRAAVETVRRESLDAGVPVGRIAADGTDARDAIDDGYSVVRIGGEVEAVRHELGSRLAEIDATGDGDGE